MRPARSPAADWLSIQDLTTPEPEPPARRPLAFGCGILADFVRM